MTEEQQHKALDWAEKRYADDEDNVVICRDDEIDAEDEGLGVWVKAWVWVPARVYQGENE